MIDSLQDQTNNGVIEEYCHRNDPANCSTYGGLYQWNEAMQHITTGGTRGVCPTGWHIPTLTEFQILKAAVNNDGNALKAACEGRGDGAGTNTSGFSALLAGYRSNGRMGALGVHTFMWSFTEYYPKDADCLSLWWWNSEFGVGHWYKGDGYSVRCLKD